MGSSRASGAPAGPCTLENPWRGPQGLQALSRASAQTWGRTACGSWRPTTSVTSSCTCRASGTGRPHKCWRSTVPRPVPGEVRGWPGHPHSSPWHRGEGAPSSRCPTPAPPSPHLPSPHGPKLLSTGRFPELKSSFLDRFDKACKSHGLGPEKIIRFSNQGRRQGLQHQQPGPARRSRARGVGMGAQGLGWGRDLRQSLSESLTVFSDPCYARSRYPSRPSGA